MDGEGKKEVRAGARIGGDLLAELQKETVRRGGPRDARGGGEGFSDIIRDALEDYLARRAAGTVAFSERARSEQEVQLLKTVRGDRAMLKAILALTSSVEGFPRGRRLVEDLAALLLHEGGLGVQASKGRGRRK